MRNARPAPSAGLLSQLQASLKAGLQPELDPARARVLTIGFAAAGVALLALGALVTFL